MNIITRTWLILLCFFMVIMQTWAQEQDFIKDEGEVVEGEFLINKELEITLPAAQRIFQKVPPDELNTRDTEPLEYTFKEYIPRLSDIRTRLKVLKLKSEKNIFKPASYLKLGFGNYVTPYLEAALNSGTNSDGGYGIKLRHISSANGPVDNGNSGDGHTSIDLFGRYIGGHASISGDLEYNRDRYYFYGYDPGVEVSKDSIEQTFNDINLGFAVQSSQADASIQYKLTGRLHNVSDSYDASELGFMAGLRGMYGIDESMHAKLGLDFLVASYKNPEEINRSLVRVYPSFVYSDYGLTVDVGMKIVNQNDTLNNKNKTQIFPALKVEYELSDDISAYGILEGDIEEVTFKSIVNENPFVNSNIPLTHTNKNLDIQVGLKGNLIENMAFDVAVRSAIYKNLYFYVNDPLVFNRFGIQYDEGNTSLFQGIVSLSYVKNNVLGSTLSLRLNAFNPGELDDAWHRPKLEFDYSFWYNFYDKIKLSADLFVLTGIEVVDLRETDPFQSTLEGAVDLNLKVDYTLSERYGVFVSVNNLLNNNYQLYNRYPTRGLLAIVGLSVSF